MNKVSNNILARVYILFGLFMVFGAVILLRVMALQLNSDEWLKREIEEKVFFKKVVADRGAILAEDGRILAASLPYYRIAMDPTVVDTASFPNFQDSLRSLASHLANYFGKAEVRRDTLEITDSTLVTQTYDYIDTLLYYNRVRDAMARGRRHVYLTRRKLNFKELKMVQSWPILRLGRLHGGLIVEKLHNERFYPYNEMAQITLGRVMNDTLGIRGIEASYNDELRGKDGYILAQKIAGKSYIPLGQYGEDHSVDGKDIITTLDVDLQDVVEKALKRGVEGNMAKAGTAILLEVGTGKIKAIANWPETYNHGFATLIEPGSTFKMISATAAMEDDLIDLCDTIDTGNGTLELDEFVIKDITAYGLLAFEDVIAHSSNVGMAKVTESRFGKMPERFIWHLGNFGFLAPVSEQIKGEPTPIVIKPGDKFWNVTTLPSMGIGYSIQVTPLQMATFYNGLANKGRLMRPWLVKEIRDNSTVVASFGPQVLNEHMCSEWTAIKARELMKGVVERGTAARVMKGLPFQVAGKTGTARKTRNGRYVNLHRASFGGFFPADNPRYTLFVMIDEPANGDISGGRVAAPVFRQIAEQVYTMDQELSRLPRKKDERPNSQPAVRLVNAQSAVTVYRALGVETSGVPAAEWLRTESNGHQVNLREFTYVENVIPNVKGMTTRDAVHLLEKIGVAVEIRGFGRGRGQSLLPGYRIGKDAAITLFCGG